jgi:hypothetical protein
MVLVTPGVLHRLSLVAGLDLFWFSLILSIHFHPIKSAFKTDPISKTDPIHKTEPPPFQHLARNPDSESKLKTTITFASELESGPFFSNRTELNFASDSFQICQITIFKIPKFGLEIGLLIFQTFIPILGQTCRNSRGHVFAQKI